MFGFLKKSSFNKNDIYAPVDGKCIDITSVKDKVFSQKMMGDGVAVLPKENVIKAPCSGVVTMLFPTKHAFGITMDNGVEVLIHIGIDTVNLNGEGFTAFCKKNQKVKKGDKIIEFDKEYLKNSKYNMSTMIIITNSENHEFEKPVLEKDVSIEDAILTMKLME